jgi:hypothetical protein
MAIVIATLDGNNLPTQFSYQPYSPRKRVSVTGTAGAVITQAATPVIVHGDSTVSWQCPTCFPFEYMTFRNLFEVADLTLYTFTGYWGEVYEVRFSAFDPPSVRGRLFDLSGQFVVVCVTTEINAACSS